MHAPHRAPSSIVGDARLNKDRLHAMVFELLCTKTAGEKASVVLPPFELDDEGALELRLSENHVTITRRLRAGRIVLLLALLRGGCV